MKLTLKQQGKILKIQRRLEELEAKGKTLKGSKLINLLLPKYDMSIHNGKPVEWNGTYYEDGNIKDWHNAEQLEKGLKGGERAGKTFPLEAEAIKLSFVNRPEFHLSVSPSFDNACETVVEVLKMHCNINELAYDWYKSNNLFLIYWGTHEEDTARILIHGMDSEWLGVTAASGDLNEPFSIKNQAFLDWRARISSPTAKELKRLWGGTAVPESMQWGHEYFDEVKIVTPTLYADTIITYGNKYLPIDYINDLDKKYTEKQKEVRLLGRCIRLTEGDAVYYGYSDKNKKPFVNENDFEFALSFDFNINPMTCVMAALKPGRIHFNKSFKIKKSSTGELCDQVINWLKDNRLVRKDGYSLNGSSFIITGDATGKHGDTRSHLTDWLIIQNKFEEAKIKVTIAVYESNPSIRDSVNEVNSGLESLKILIDPVECKDLLRTFDMTAWKDGAKGFAINEQAEWGHHSACIRYLVWHTAPIHSNEAGASQVSSVSLGYRESRH